MFIIQNCGVTTQEPLEISKVNSVMAEILEHWRSDSDARKDIIETNEIPAVFQGSDVPAMLAGIRVHIGCTCTTYPLSALSSPSGTCDGLALVH
jgi:hypothetical protein